MSDYIEAIANRRMAEAAGKVISRMSGNANGIATLDGAGKIPVSQIPDDVINDIDTASDEEISAVVDAYVTL